MPGGDNGTPEAKKQFELELRRMIHGLSAAVYTQTADVETECNGLMTYDCAIIKFDLKKTAEANRF